MEKSVNQRVMMLKSQLNLTNNEFCLRAEISTATLYSIQSGTQMKQKTIKTIAEAFNVNKEWLLTGKGQMFNDPKTETITSVDPWRDALVQQVKEENVRLVEEVKWLRQMVSQFTNGLKPNFRNLFIQKSLPAAA